MFYVLHPGKKFKEYFSNREFIIIITFQEAHPAKLKAIHILNTASWIHHIMRIVLPLVKSELISIVKFHKGTCTTTIQILKNV